MKDYPKMTKTLYLLILLMFISFLTAENSINSRINKFTLSDRDYIDKYEIITTTDGFALSSVNNLKKNFSDFIRTDEGALWRYSWNNNESFLQLQFQGGASFGYNKDADYYFTYRGLILNSQMSENVKLHANWWAGYFKRDVEYVKESTKILDSFYKLDGPDKIQTDNLTAWIQAETKFGTFKLGRSSLSIGDNISGSIILNDDCNEYGFFKWTYQMGDFEIDFADAMLIPDSTRSYLSEDGDHPKDYEDKHLVYHKLSWKPSEKFMMYVGEEVIYSGRGADLSYLLPHTFYRVTEHNLRDRDNILIFAGYRYIPKDWMTFYGSFIFDELRKSELTSDWWGNKYALQTGVSFKSEFLMKPKLTFEYTAARPWLYTHKIQENKFTHDQISLGHPDGANFVDFTTELNLRICKRIKFDMAYSMVKKGSTGNSALLNYNTRQSDEARWLDGEKSDEQTITGVLTWRPNRHHQVKLSLEYNDDSLINYDSTRALIDYCFIY